jgi:colanic acid biosynthesis glycosyl transferase WcaI
MRILIYGINYSPELTGIGKYTGEMAEWLALQGHDVHVVTAMPYYPEWKVHDTYKGKWWHKEHVNGVTIHRCPLYVPKNVSSSKRIMHEFSFLAATIPFWFKSFFSKKFDIVFCIAPPFHLGFMPVLYKSLKGSRLITHIQDLQVDAAKDLGMIRNKYFLNLMFSLEKFLLKRSSFVSTISNGMQRKIEGKQIAGSKILLFPNWVDEDAIKPLPRSQSLRKELGINDAKKVVLYSGNLGEKQGLEMIIEVARLYVNDPAVLFLICGSGGGKERLMHLAKEYALENIVFLPLQPYAKLSALLASADLHLVLQKSSASDLVMPSKLTGILAAGGCVLVTAVPDTSLYEVVQQGEMGILVEPESVGALKNGIDKALYSDVSMIKKNARSYAEQYLSKSKILSRLEMRLETIIKR